MAKSKLGLGREKAISKALVRTVVELSKRRLVAWKFDREAQTYHLDLEFEAYSSSQPRPGARTNAPAIVVSCKGDWPSITGSEVKQLVANLEQHRWDLEPVIH